MSDMTASRTLMAPGAAAREAWKLRAFCFSIYATQAVLVSYFPLYFIDKGFSSQQIGFIYSSGPMLSIAANLVAGALSDKYRTIRRILLALLFGQLAFAALLLPLSAFGPVALVMAAFYLCQTPVNPLSDSLLLMSAPHTGRPYALIRIFGSLGFCMAAYAIGLVLKLTGTGATVSIALITTAVSLVIAWQLRDYRGASGKMDFSGLVKLVRRPDIIAFFSIVLVLSVAHRMNDGFLALAMRERGASDALVGAAWSLSSLSEIPVLFLLGRYGSRFKELPLLAIAAAMYAVRFFLNARIEDPSLFLLTQLMHSVSFGIFFSTAIRYVATVIPDQYRASGMALYAVVWTGIAGVISGLAGGYWFQHLGSAPFFYIASGLALTASASILAIHACSRN
ncbi:MULTISPECIES: MFS transporter [Paenibacillus]|uniref:MFS transporter n=1 Tax=Paenibacillus TaxID=44249 RepID=UPI001E5661B2|nr:MULTISPECIES: MFS transporter [Paenibacillus]